MSRARRNKLPTDRDVRSTMLEMRYHDSYFYTQIVTRTLSDPFLYLRGMNEFFGDPGCRGFIWPFPKHTILHSYAYFCIEKVDWEQFPSDDDIAKQVQLSRFLPKEEREHVLPIETAMAAHGIAHASFLSWLAESGATLADAGSDEAFEYYDYIAEERNALYERIAEEVFFLGFMNRRMLQSLCEMAASVVADQKVHDAEPDEREQFAADGVLRRVRTPAWAKRAVFFRDRGRCVFCLSDLSGAGALSRKCHYDHIVALASGGPNDVTNLQLLCEQCNLKKSAGLPATRNHVERWF